MTVWTLAEYTALKAAVASGALQVSYGDPPRTVRYHSLAEMRALLKDMEGALGLSTDARESRTEFHRA